MILLEYPQFDKNTFTFPLPNISIDILRITSKYVSNTTESGIEFLFGLKEATICFLFQSFYANYDSIDKA